MIERQCKTCKDWKTPLTEHPCSVCNLFAGDPVLNMWTERSSRHDRVGEKLRGNQRKGRPYIRRSSAELKKGANCG